MKKTYIQPEIELLKVSALNDFLIGSPEQETVIETTGGATDSFIDGGASGDDAFGGEWA